MSRPGFEPTLEFSALICSAKTSHKTNRLIDLVSLSCNDIYFGLLPGKELISFIIILAKNYIFNNKCTEVPLLSITAFKEFVYSYFKTEKAIATRNGSLDDHNKKWVNMF